MPFNDETREKLQRLMAGGLGLSGPAFVELAEHAQRQQKLMADAMFIAGKSQEQIRAAVARSPYSFAEFVARLAAGVEKIE